MKKKRKIGKNTKRVMAGVVAALFLAVAAVVGIEIKSKNSVYACFEEEQAVLEYYTRYGTHLNAKGKVDLGDDFSVKEAYIALKNNKSEYKIPIEYEKDGNVLSFAISENINGGINLEAVPLGKYLLVLCVNGQSGYGESIRYYSFENTSGYDDGFSYYTLSSNGKCNNVVLKFYEHEYVPVFKAKRTIFVSEITTTECDLPEEYCDIVLEVGHGGDDPGAVGYLNGEQIKEYTLNYTIAGMIKSILEEEGFKVELSHYTDTDAPSYGRGGRAVKPNEMKAKYNFSVHCNSHELDIYSGTEVYAAKGSDFSFAKLLADKIVEKSGGSYSNQDLHEKEFYTVANGVFVRLFAPSNVESTNKEVLEMGEKPYENIEAYETNYYYMIREIGGIVTKAYVDGRNKEYGANLYVNSNDVAEPYILEMNYVNNETSLRSLYENPEGYAKGTADAICEYVNALRSEEYEKTQK